jgi:hypothetical protein
MSKVLEKNFVGCMKARPLETSCLFEGNLHHQNVRRGGLVYAHQNGEVACGSIMFH